MTLQEATVFRDAAKAAYLKAFEASNYTINSGATSRSVAYQEITKLRKEYENWQLKVDSLSGSSTRVRFLTSR